MTGDALSLAHTLAFKELWRQIPTGITGGDIITASDEQDLHKATDLIAYATSEHKVAMRVRGHEALLWDGGKDIVDWSVRTKVKNGGATEIDKLRAGHCSRYFQGCSDTYFNAKEAAKDALHVRIRTAQLRHAYIIDVNGVREAKLLDELVRRDNGDGTEGGYLTFRKLNKRGCILWTTPNIGHLWTIRARQRQLF